MMWILDEIGVNNTDIPNVTCIDITHWLRRRISESCKPLFLYCCDFEQFL